MVWLLANIPSNQTKGCNLLTPEVNVIQTPVLKGSLSRLVSPCDGKVSVA